MIVSRNDWPSVRDDIASLFRISFAREIKDGYLDWRYLENSSELYFNVEIDGDATVASYSVFPVELTRNNSVYKTALSMSTMTHPRWQGKGLFPRLAGELYARLALDGFCLVWGFPNAKSHSVFNAKLAWSDIYEIPTLALDVTSVDVAKLPATNAASDDGFDLEYSELTEDGFIRVRRTRDYLRWRYAKHPVNRYSNFVVSEKSAVSSYFVLKEFGDSIDLVDMQAANAVEAGMLLARVVKHASSTGKKQIFTWAATHHWIHSVLERHGFQNTSPVTYFGGRVLEPSGNELDALNHRNWYVQMGDSDVY